MLVDVAHVFICVGKPLQIVLMLVEGAVLGVCLVGQKAVGAAKQVGIDAIELDKIVVVVDLMPSPAELAGLGGIAALDGSVAKPPAHTALGGLVSVAFLGDAAAMAILEVECSTHKCVGQYSCGGVVELYEEQAGGGAPKQGPSGLSDEALGEGI